ncbi:hypothetical protein TSOC_010436, partial [Tetrabaena socialis]
LQHVAAPAPSSDPSRIWLPEIVEHFARSLAPNEVAGTLRLINKATAAQFRGPQHTTVQLSQPVPHHAFVWRWTGPGAMRCLTRKRRCELPCLTACSGVITNLEVLLAQGDLPPSMDDGIFKAAAAAGQLDVCIWLREQGYLVKEVVAVAAAAGAGQQAVCEWLLANGCPEADWWKAAAASAAEGGHVGLMDWLLLRAAPLLDEGVFQVEVDLLKGAAIGCDLSTLQRLHHTYANSRAMELRARYKPDLISAAAGSLTADWQAKVEWLEARGYSRTVNAGTVAAAKPDALPRLRWLQQRGYLLDSYVAASAAGAGNVEALQYVLGRGVEVNAHMMLCAAEGGHVAIVELLHVRGAPISSRLARDAARWGHLSAVAWLAERLGADTVLTSCVYTAAAGAGSMELLAWLREWGCPWDATVFAAAAADGSEEQLEWLAEQGCPMGDNGEPYACPAAAAELGMLRCLHRLGCPWSPDGVTFTRAVDRVCARDIGQDIEQHVERGLCWLLDQGCPVDWDEAEAAAGGSKALERWLCASQ